MGFGVDVWITVEGGSRWERIKSRPMSNAISKVMARSLVFMSFRRVGVELRWMKGWLWRFAEAAWRGRSLGGRRC